MWLDTRHRQKISTENIICPNALDRQLKIIVTKTCLLATSTRSQLVAAL